MSNPKGRPLKYKNILLQLQDHKLYSPATIAQFAEENQFFKSAEPQGQKLERQRIRIAMGRLSNSHRFPDEGDGQVKKPGQRPLPGWFGWRWKAVLVSKN